MIVKKNQRKGCSNYLFQKLRIFIQFFSIRFHGHTVKSRRGELGHLGTMKKNEKLPSFKNSYADFVKNQFWTLIFNQA